jgi:SlyX protein
MENTEINSDDMVNALEQRLDALESRTVFQEDIIDQLSDELALHQTKISELKEQIKLMATRIKDAGSMEAGKDEIEPPPPHY